MEQTLGDNKLLQIQNIVSGYGKKDVLHGVSLEVRKGEIVVLIGPNGAGKSTVLKTLLGYLSLSQGKVIFCDEDISGIQPHKAIRLGISYLPQGRVIFPDMTVSEHLDIGGWILEDKQEKQKSLERVYRMFPRLKDRKGQKAKTMSGGERQMMILAQVLMVNPALLLVDEPSLGLAPKLVDMVFEKILDLNQQGLTILMVEQNAVKALKNSDRGYVLEMGKNRYEGKSEDLLNNEDVRRLYLGG